MGRQLRVSRQIMWAADKAKANGHKLDWRHYTDGDGMESVPCAQCETFVQFDHETMKARGHDLPCAGVADLGLDTIAERLIELRKQTEALDMQKARLFKRVKDEDLYKEQFETFAAFCEHVGYHRSTVYTLIRCYEQEAVRVAYTDIGALAAKQIERAARKLEKVAPDTADDTVAGLIEFAKENPSSATREHVKDTVAEAEGDSDEPEAEAAEEDNLKALLNRKSELLNRKSDLEQRIAKITSELSKVEEKIDELSE